MSTSRWRGPAWRVVNADPGNVKLVRAWISSAISRYGCPVDPAEATLAVSELFTNAVTHGPGARVLVGYCMWPYGARIVVADGGSRGTPELRPAATWDEGGRGLLVVDGIAADWGCFCFKDAARLIVWCDLGYPVRSPVGDAWAWLHRLLSADVLGCASASERAALAPARTEAATGEPVHPAVAGAGRGATP